MRYQLFPTCTSNGDSNSLVLCINSLKYNWLMCLSQTGGRFKWVDNWALSFTKWGKDEPKNNYACVYMDVDKTWKTAPCTRTYSSLCKRSPGQTVPLLVFLIVFGYPAVSETRNLLSLFQMWPPLSPHNCLETVLSRRSEKHGYLSEATVMPSLSPQWTTGPMRQLNA